MTAPFNEVVGMMLEITSDVYRCETCGQTFSKKGNGAMGRFKQHLDSHSSNRFFKSVQGINSSSVPAKERNELE